MTRSDPVGENYYKPLRRADRASDICFYVGAVLSVASFIVDKGAHPGWHNAVQTSFVLSVIILFVLGISIRLYFAPRAEDRRRQELLSNSFSVALLAERTEEYYNNSQTSPPKRLAASEMESAFFTYKITQKMLVLERWKTGIYLLAWLGAAVFGKADLELLAIAAQAIFGEQILAKWWRMEWLRGRSEATYCKFFDLFQTKPSFARKEVQARVFDIFGEYETTKSSASIVLSDRIFNQMNPRLSAEWEVTCKTLGL